MKNRIISLFRGDIERIFREAVGTDATYNFGQKITHIDNRFDGVQVTLTNGEKIEGDILIGADGIHSDTREMVFGPEKNYLRYLGLHTAAYFIENSSIADDIGNNFEMLAEPGYQIGIAKLEDGRVAVFFAFTDDQMIRPKDPAEYLREKFGHLGVYVPEILDAADQIDDIYYDWMAQIELPKWHKNRVVLIGDACYAVSLLAGQGASMAVGGAEVLASYIGDGDIDGGLDRFEAAMKPDIAKKQAAGRKNAKWMVPTSKFHLWVRNVFLKLIGLPGLSHLLRWFLAASIKSLPRNE